MENVQINHDAESPPTPRLFVKEYRTASAVNGPMVAVERVRGVGFNELAEIHTPDQVRAAQVLEINRERALVQVFAGTRGLSLAEARLRFTGEVARLDVSLDMLGRTFNGSGRPIDGGPPLVPAARLDIQGYAINPMARAHPSEFIQTGISAIDGLN